MLFFSKWKITFILGAVLLGFFFALPNALPEKARENLPGMFQRTMNLGLDLQGGAHMLLEVDLSSVMTQALDNEREAIRDAFRDADRLRTEFIRVEDNAVVIRLDDVEDVDTALTELNKLSVAIDQTSLSQDKTTNIERVGDKGFSVTITEANVESIQARTIAQSIEVLRKRIDPQGTTEMTLAREGDDRILLQVPGAKNVSEIKDRINKTANLSFHMVHADSTNAAAIQKAAQDDVVRTGNAYYPMQEGGTGPVSYTHLTLPTKA